MSKRIYNVLFHTHTVSGLVIGVALYVIFFTGSISFFRDDIISWERNQPIEDHAQMGIDYDLLIDTVAAQYELYGRDITLRQFHQERRMMVSMTPSKDTAATEAARRRAFFYQDPEIQTSHSYFEDFTLGEFIYRLHFFAQIPYPYGYLLSGFVAFFFLFAVVTGVIVHWKKIISNCYLFRPRAKLKTIWTDAHTALGMIGLPFQFMYAVTGAVVIIGSTIMLFSASSFFYDGDTEKLYQDLSTDIQPKPFLGDSTVYDFSLNDLVDRTRNHWKNVRPTKVILQNYGDKNMQIIVEVKPNHQAQFSGMGQVVYKPGGQSVYEKDPYCGTSYLTGVNDTIRQLHFGNYGGYGLKIIYFIFGIITCFVILSGVLIWVEARDKKSNEPWKRKSNEWVASIFIALALTLYPVTALSFDVVKLFGPLTEAPNHVFIYKVYFLSWLVLSILFSIKRDHFFTTKVNLILGSILGFVIPIANGVITGNWVWRTFYPGTFQIFVVDVFWLIIPALTLSVALKMKRKPNESFFERSTQKTTA